MRPGLSSSRLGTLHLVMLALLVLLTLSSFLHGQPVKPILRQLHLVFRHGERSPQDTYPNDPYINSTFSPYGWGQLTNVGRMSQYKQGQWLKERYSGFLKDYSPSKVEAWTTDVDRTKMSMQLMMAGLFPPKGMSVWNRDLLWQPISYSHQKLSDDKLLLVRSCPRYQELFNKVLKEPEVVARMDSYRSLFDELTKYTGRNISNPDDVQDVYSTLVAEKTYGLELPPWTNEFFPQPMEEVTAWSFELNVINDELKRIKGGPLVKKVLSDAKSLSEGKPSKTLFAYAGHDSTVSNLLMALDVWETQVPVYNILAILELYQTGHSYGFKVLLRNTTEEEPYTLRVPGCKEICPLEDLTRLTQGIVPPDINKDCLPTGTTETIGDRGP